ncbi:hypothetical protein ACFLS1_03260 [Verrucomicrobiota bacterium]
MSDIIHAVKICRHIVVLLWITALLMICGCTSTRRSAGPRINGISHDENKVTISFTGKKNERYQLQRTDNLLKADWENIGPAVTAESEKIIFVDSGVTNDKMFYRVISPQK